MKKASKYYTLITGASSGIGQQMAIQCAELGHHLILTALPKSGLKNTAHAIKSDYGVEVWSYSVNLIEENGVLKLYDFLNANGLSVNILINNVGMGYSKMFSETEVSRLEHLLILNNSVMMRLTHLLVKDLIQYGKGAYILNVGSLASFIPIPGKAVYSASKSFVLNFSLALRGELQSHGVSVSCLCPGPVNTNDEMLDRFKDAGNYGKWILETSEKVASVGIKKMVKGKAMIYTSFKIFILIWLARMLPGKVVSFLAGRVFKGISEKEIASIPAPSNKE